MFDLIERETQREGDREGGRGKERKIKGEKITLISKVLDK